MKKIVIAAGLFAALSVPAFSAAAAGFYVAQDAKTHACAVTDKKPDGKAAMDVGTKVYDSEENAKKALANLKACAAAPAGFYVAQDAKSHKCAVVDKAPDGKAAMDVGTKVYDSEENAKKALANLKVCN
ncbi:MAG: hypothetical protein KGO53_05925 [Alphaproteobacteria bacterium]|nr:hypothetical protein [Alphaproteobacteria bacterium]